ncbi:Nudix hydrolase 7 [Linum grandiflorum]
MPLCELLRNCLVSFHKGKSSDGSSSSSSIRIRSMGSLSSSETAVSADANVHGVNEIELLEATEDWYGGVTMAINQPMEVVEFVPRLKYSISRWKEQGKKGVWIKLPKGQSNLVHPIIEEGFRFHHAEPDYVMLVRWLPEDLPDTLPINASHRVGVGALVVNDNKEVLVVTERHGGFKGTEYWKMPTGVVEEGEDIWAAAVREVKEETGIDAEFVEMLTFRQSHKSFFSKSDLMFVCMLRPLSANITAQQSEIEAAKWMPVNEYVDQPYNQKHGQFKYMAEICKAKVEGAYVGFSSMPVKSASGKKVDLYYNKQQVQNKL